jgi:hypothetical protein
VAIPSMREALGIVSRWIPPSCSPRFGLMK